MAVHSFEHDPLSIQSHDAVLHLKPAESYFFGNEFLKFSFGIVHFDLQIIEFRILRTPESRVLDLHCDASVFQRKLLFERDIAPRQSDLCLSFAPGFRADLKFSFCERLIRYRADPEITDMYIRHGIKVYIPVDPRESVKILVLAPAAGGPLEHLRRKLVHSILHMVRQFEFRGCERIFTVSDELTVQPERDPALRSLERDEKPFPFHPFRHFKIFYIARDRIEPLRDLPRSDLFMSFPRILCVRILRYIIPLQLDMRRNMDIIPAAAVIVFCLKSRDR